MKQALPFAFALLLLATFVSASQTADSLNEMVGSILEDTKTEGGLVVHLGAMDGRVTAALRKDDRFTVHGLALSEEAVAKSRATIESLGLYGLVSVELLQRNHLPYTDNLVNLILVTDQGQVDREDILRVLVPGGTALFAENEPGKKWEQITKPWPADIDDWTHFLHDAKNNAVAEDEQIGPPRRLQWVAPPLWLRSHETPSGIEATVCGDGRVFYIFDEGPIGITDERLPDRWSLICRDAFNGKLLWRVPLGKWGWREWNRGKFEGKDWTKLRAARTDVPQSNQRRLVVQGDRLYATLGYNDPVRILDAATGKTLTTVMGTEFTREIASDDGLVIAYASPPSNVQASRRGENPIDAPHLVAFDGQSGNVLWKHETGSIRDTQLAIDAGRVVYQSGAMLTALDLTTGKQLWNVKTKGGGSTMIAIDETIVFGGGSMLSAYDATDGSILWSEKALPVSGFERSDLFVIDGLVWQGASGSPSTKIQGRDLRSGEVKRKIYAKDIRSPEHHHRCYRNKATSRYILTAMEGIEMIDLRDDCHDQNNWLRGSCKYGIMPAYGMMYVPADQCFCHPGSKILGFTAVKAEAESPVEPVADEDRLAKGEAYGVLPVAIRISSVPSSARADWPTFRHDSARSGSTNAKVKPEVTQTWSTKISGKLTSPVAVGDKVYVAAKDAHTLYALDMASGDVVWKFTTGGRIDSPPTIHDGLVLFGSADGSAYCLREKDGKLVWRFLAAKADVRLGAFDQIESVWPVHGSVLVEKGVAYFMAGRSTYLDGGIQVWGLDPASGKILHKGLLDGPWPKDLEKGREVSFYTLGANSDILCTGLSTRTGFSTIAEDGMLYMRQKKMNPQLEEIKPEILSSKGEADVGHHIFSTAGFLDGSGYNRTFWMNSKRWPGFQLANQAPKSGQLLVVDDAKTYAVRVFYKRNTHSPMFFPGKEGNLLFADRNDNEPQIVGEEGAVEPVRWLPMSDYDRGRGGEVRKLGSRAFGQDKGIGYTRAKPPLWQTWIQVRICAMVKTPDAIFVAGQPDTFDENEPFAALDGKRGGKLIAVSPTDGKVLSEMDLDSEPIFDGIIAAGDSLIGVFKDGTIRRLR